MAYKKINFDVFKLSAYNSVDDIIGFETVLLNVLSSYRPIHKNTGPISLSDAVKQHGKFIVGTLAHTQMNDLPNYRNTQTGETGQLPLNDEQGLDYNTSFLFDKELQMLALESKKNGVSLQLFCNFFQHNYDLNKLETEIVIDPIEMQKLQRMSVVKKFKVKIAKVANGEIFSDGGKRQSFGQIIDSADGTNTDTLEYVLTASRLKSDSLNVNKIKQFIRELLIFRDTEEVTKLELTGKEDEDAASYPINFIGSRVRFQIEVERKRFSESFALQEKYSLLKESYNKIRPNLLKAYKYKAP
ncbi:hypothetical protein FC093_20135 [Ilyomonas limi]|uniref:Uncharacterized protein n=1 Tax=Ilyomonas limi TaxID=2575867 RepID=A0A4U3KSZ2_9BACT|nr:DUF6731 family protein [Ilyomonas limi]TKK65422.1 hypothetical protein FC093_20135 [Ilyomonas limi]